jgi:hypothetical protein
MLRLTRSKSAGSAVKRANLIENEIGGVLSDNGAIVANEVLERAKSKTDILSKKRSHVLAEYLVINRKYAHY